MQIFRGFHHAGLASACALTIGNFDGVHRGHQAMLALLRSEARHRGVPSCVMTFEPHPRDFFAGLLHDSSLAPARIANLRDKLEELRACGVDQCVVLPFNQAFASQQPQAFIDEVLLQGLGVRYLLVGDDFRFGARRAGDYDLLVRAGREQGFDVARMKLDCRTLNVRFQHWKPAASGIFVARVHGLQEQPLHGVANLGVRPSLDANDVNGGRVLLETHCLAWPAPLGLEGGYGKIIRVELLPFNKALPGTARPHACGLPPMKRTAPLAPPPVTPPPVARPRATEFKRQPPLAVPMRASRLSPDRTAVPEPRRTRPCRPLPLPTTAPP